MKENTSYTGTFVIEIIDDDTGVKTEVVHNKIMDTILDQLISTLLGTAPDLQIKYLALGTSNTPVSTSDVKLGTEIFRTAITSQTKTATGTVETEFSILATEAIGQIEEVGIFGGSTATATADSGTLISRILWSHEKTNSEELTIKRIDRISRG